MTKTNPREGKTWPGYVFGGRLRTSTLVLVIAFSGFGWMFHNWEPSTSVPQQVPASEVVPPGFIPDPAYTWAPRTDVQPRNPVTTTTTTPTTPTSPTTTPTTPTTSVTVTPTPSSVPAEPGGPTSPPAPTSVEPTAPPVATESATSSPVPAGGGASAPAPPPR
jgi:hypothetical protein